jgi:muconolactone delta-isomerase
VATTTISLPDDQLARLRQHALTSRRSLDEVVREAVDAYLAQLPETAAPRDAEPPPSPPDPTWQATTQIAADGMRVRVPPAMTPDEARALLAEPSPEARREHLARWLMDRGARVVEPPPGPPSPEWQARVEAALARIRARVPADMTPDEIEALITEASEEARAERIARRDAERRSRVANPGATTKSPEWSAGIDAALARLRSNVPADLTPEEIDAEIDAAWEEVRQERRKRRASGD